MARQAGILKLTGSISDLNFYRTKDGYFARSKSSLNRQRIAEDPAFERTREGNVEFGTVSKDTTLFRQSLAGFSTGVPMAHLRRRLMSLFLSIKDLDMDHSRGQRRVTGGLQHAAGRDLLDGFEWNGSASLGLVVCKPAEPDFHQRTLSLRHLVAERDVLGPRVASHVCFSSCLVRIDFPEHRFVSSVSVPLTVPVDEGTERDIVLSHAELPPGDGFCLFVLKMTFFQLTGDVLYPLRDGRYHAMTIVGIANGVSFNC